ncbi:MAG: bile acid:sodium symporter [Coraliomargaritaceae bacterium]
MRIVLKKYGFIGGLALAIFFGASLPNSGVHSLQLFNVALTDIGIWLIFLRQGLSLQTHELFAGRNPLRLHAYVLSWNFVLFPLLTGLLLFLVRPYISEELKQGFYLLSILPTTVVSAIAMTSASGGNTANALFSSVYSNLIAVIWVPIVGLLYLRFSDDPVFGIPQALLQLSLLIVLPLFLGQCIRSFFTDLSSTICRKTTWFCPAIILWLVFNAFSRSVQSQSFKTVPCSEIIFAILFAGFLLFLVSGLVAWSSGWLRLERGTRIAAFYCASQKSLVTGLPLVATILNSIQKEEIVAVILLPILAYHTQQLVFAAGLLHFQRKQV